MMQIEIRTYEVTYRDNITKHRAETFRGAANQAFEMINGTAQERGKRADVIRKTKGRETSKTREVVYNFDGEDLYIKRIR